VPGLSQNGTGLFFCSTQEKQTTTKRRKEKQHVSGQKVKGKRGKLLWHL
jgi:hypothetical protein